VHRHDSGHSSPPARPPDPSLDELRAKGTYFKLRILDDQQAPVCHYDGREVINLASNNYLGLANHPKLIEAALAATRAFGVGSGAVRTIAGTMRIHMELEEKIARFKNVEACVVFQSGFAANAGTVSAILGKEDFILSDELNHASIIDGARLSRATIKVFRHKDVAHCEELLQELENARVTSSSSPTASSPWTATSAPSTSWRRWPRNTAPS
jgi:glycine C-acetyltransferase